MEADAGYSAMDFAGVLLLPDIAVIGLGRPEIPHPVWMALRLALILAAPLYLWLIHPLAAHTPPHRKAGLWA